MITDPPFYRLFETGLIRRFYLDEMPELADAPLGLSILYLIMRTESEAPATARALVARTKGEIEDGALRGNLIELIETVIMYKLARLGREEIQAMLEVHDIRETRVYQEAREEGIQEERQRNLEGKLRSIERMATKMSAEDIAAALDLDLGFVRKHMAR